MLFTNNELQQNIVDDVAWSSMDEYVSDKSPYFTFLPIMVDEVGVMQSLSTTHTQAFRSICSAKRKLVQIDKNHITYHL